MFRFPKAALIRAPKTGSTWVIHCMRDGLGIRQDNQHPVGQHFGLSECLPHLHDRTPFTIVRNPLTWLPSLYRQMRRSEAKPKWTVIEGPCAIFGGMRHETFQEFVEHVASYQGLVGDVFSRYEVDHVLKTESLRQDLADFLAAIGEDFDRKKLLEFPATNVSGSNRKKASLDCEWTRDLKLRVIESEWEFMEKHGYL